jgi:hypothetical protein
VFLFLDQLVPSQFDQDFRLAFLQGDWLLAQTLDPDVRTFET